MENVKTNRILVIICGKIKPQSNWFSRSRSSCSERLQASNTDYRMQDRSSEKKKETRTTWHFPERANIWAHFTIQQEEGVTIKRGPWGQRAPDYITQSTAAARDPKSLNFFLKRKKSELFCSLRSLIRCSYLPFWVLISPFQHFPSFRAPLHNCLKNRKANFEQKSREVIHRWLLQLVWHRLLNNSYIRRKKFSHANLCVFSFTPRFSYCVSF